MVKKVINVTQNTVVVDNLELATTAWQRFKGLMGRSGISAGGGLWLEPCADIHSCFMRFAFDAVFLNKEGVVLHLIEAMAPWRLSKYVFGGRVVLELPAGEIARHQLALGDQLIIQS